MSSERYLDVFGNEYGRTLPFIIEAEVRNSDCVCVRAVIASQSSYRVLQIISRCHCTDHNCVVFGLHSF